MKLTLIAVAAALTLAASASAAPTGAPVPPPAATHAIPATDSDLNAIDEGMTHLWELCALLNTPSAMCRDAQMWKQEIRERWRTDVLGEKKK